MGNENSTTEGEAYTESLTQRDDRTLLTEPSTSQQSLLSQPVLPDVPVITGVEESRSTAGDQEDKGELEFPHDLLPSLDFSSELNIWESSLGTQTSSDERKCEQVNPLLAGLQHHMEVSRPLVVLDTRPHDCDPVLTDAQPSPRPTAPPSPTHLLLDRELQEAFKECEEQMASLGLLQLKEPLSTMSETVNEKEEKTGEAMVNKLSESSSLPPIVVQPGHSNRGHGNKCTHGNSEAANSEMDTVVFSFRNYILGTENSDGAAETESKIKTTQSQEKCPEIKPEEETDKDEHTHLEMTTNTDSFKETPKDTVFSKQKDDIMDNSNAVIEEKGTPDCNAVIREKDTEAITETADVKKENQSDESSINTYMVENKKKDDISDDSNAVIEEKGPPDCNAVTREKDIEAITETANIKKEIQSDESDINTNMIESKKKDDIREDSNAVIEEKGPPDCNAVTREKDIEAITETADVKKENQSDESSINTYMVENKKKDDISDDCNAVIEEKGPPDCNAVTREKDIEAITETADIKKENQSDESSINTYMVENKKKDDISDDSNAVIEEKGPPDCNAVTREKDIEAITETANIKKEIQSDESDINTNMIESKKKDDIREDSNAVIEEKGPPDCNAVTREKDIEAITETADVKKENQSDESSINTYMVENKKKDDISDDCNAVIEEKGPPDCNAVTREKDIEAITETADIKKENQSDESSINTYMVENKKKDDISDDCNAVIEEKGPPDCNAVIREKDIEAITETADVKKENQSDESTINTYMVENKKKDDISDDSNAVVEEKGPPDCNAVTREKDIEAITETANIKKEIQSDESSINTNMIESKKKDDIRDDSNAVIEEKGPPDCNAVTREKDIEAITETADVKKENQSDESSINTYMVENKKKDDISDDCNAVIEEKGPPDCNAVTREKDIEAITETADIKKENQSDESSINTYVVENKKKDDISDDSNAVVEEKGTPDCNAVTREKDIEAITETADVKKENQSDESSINTNMIESKKKDDISDDSNAVVEEKGTPDCNAVTREKDIEAITETADVKKENQSDESSINTYVVENKKKDDIRDDSNAVIKEKGTPDCNAVTREKDIEAITETADVKKENQSDESSINTNMIESKKKDDISDDSNAVVEEKGTPDCNAVTREKDIEAITETANIKKENQSDESSINTNMIESKKKDDISDDSNAVVEEKGPLDCNAVTREKDIEAITETADVKKENQSDESSINTYVVENKKKDDISDDSNAVIKEKGPPDCNAVTREKDIEAITETADVKKENQSDESSINTYMVESKKKDDIRDDFNAVIEEKGPPDCNAVTREKDIEAITETANIKKEIQSDESSINTYVVENKKKDDISDDSNAVIEEKGPPDCNAVTREKDIEAITETADVKKENQSDESSINTYMVENKKKDDIRDDSNAVIEEKGPPDCNAVTREKDIEAITETANIKKENQSDVSSINTNMIESKKKDDISDDSNAVIEEKGPPDCNAVTREKDIEAITETADIKKENQSDESSINTDMVESKKKDDSVNETSESSNLHFRDKDAVPEMQLEKQTEADKQAEARKDKKAKKKDKKKQRKKKKMEKSSEIEQKATAAQAENDLQAMPLMNAGNNTEANAESVSEADTETVMCAEQLDNGFDYKQQLSLGGNPSSSPPLSSSHIEQDHLTDLACSPASIHALSQGPHQSDNHNHTDAPCGMNHSSDASPQSEQHATGDVINNQNTTMTYVQTTVINPAASADKRSDAQTQEAIVTSEAEIHTLESWSPLSNSRTCVGESSAESALEEALVVVAALPLTTPTMPEVIESKGEGESVRRDSLERVATVAIAEREKAVGEKDSGGIGKCLSTADGERGGLLGSLPQLSLVCSQGKCSLAFSAKEGQAASEKSCSSKMPNNSAESKTKGPTESTVRSADTDTEIFPAEEGDREKEGLWLEAYLNTSPLGLLTGADCQDHSAAGLEGAGEGGGGGEEVEEKGGLAKEHSSFSQPEGSACGVSSAETETCPPTDVAESQLKSQSWGEPIATITESICTEQDRLSHPCQEQLAAAISPLPTHPEQSSCNIDGEADTKQNLISEEALSSGRTCEESSITETERNYSQVFLPLISPQPLTTSQQITVERQASNNQQVRPESSTTEAKTAESAAEVQAQTQINSGSPDMSGVGMYVYNNSGGNNRVHFADSVKQEGSSSVDLKNMSVSALECASLPPLTVHENLHYPVVEACFIFKDFLSLKKPEIPIEAAPTKDKPAIQSSTDLQKPQKDVQLDKGDIGTKETLNIARDQSGKDNSETDTVDLQPVTEACSKPLPSPTEKSQTVDEERFDLLQTTKCDGSAISDHVTVEEVSAKVPKQEEVETEKGAVKPSLSKENEPDELHVESKGSVKTNQPQESPIISDATMENVIVDEKEGNQHPHAPCSVLPADNVTCKPLSDTSIDSPDAQPATDLDSGSHPETVTLTCTASLQTKPTDPGYQPPTQFDQSPPHALITTDAMDSSEGSKSMIHSADLTKDEPVTSEVTAVEQSISVSEQYASNPAFVLQPPGPMLSHLEFINDSDISLPEQKDSCSADGTLFSGEVDSNKRGEITQRSLAEHLEHSDVNVEAENTRNDAADSFVAPENSLINTVNFPSDYKITSSQEESPSPQIHPPGAVGVVANGGSDNVISHTESDSIGIKPVICKASIRDDLINASCPLSSDLPTNEARDEIKKDSMKETRKLEDETSVLFKEEKKQLEQTTMDNQKETADSNKLETGKTGTKPQQSNGPDKETAEEIGDLQLSHKHKVQKTESPIRDLKEEGERQSDIACKSETETPSLSSDRPAGSSEDMLCAEVESGSEHQSVYGQSLRQTLTVTQAHSSDGDTAPHDWCADPGQSQSTQDPNSFAQQQEQQQQRLGSRHPTEELSGGCLEGREGGEKTNGQIRQTQALVPGVKGVAEGGDDSVGSLCQSGSGDDLTAYDSSGNERVISLEKGEEEGAQAVPGVDRVCVPSPLASDLNENGRAAETNALADIGIITASSHVGETRQEMDENNRPGLEVDESDTDLMPDADFPSSLGGKGQQKRNPLAACQDQHEALRNTAVSVESASQEHETSSLGFSVSPKVSTDSHVIHTDVVPSANQAEEIHTKIFSSLLDPVGQPETVEKNFIAAPAVKSESGETEECEIQDTVCEPLELQSSNKTSATQSSPVVETPIKGPDVEEITKGDKATLDEEKASSQREEQSDIIVINNEATEKQGVVNLSGSADDSGPGSIKDSDVSEGGVSHSSTDTTVCQSEGSIALVKATENDNDTTDKINPHVITVPPAVLSKCPEDIASTPLAAPSQSEKPHDQLSLSKSPDDIVVTPLVTAGQCEAQEKDTCISPVEQVSVKAEAAQVSKSPAPELKAQEPETNWIKALRDAASQAELESTVATSRPLPSLESPQLEFLTPTEEIAAPLRQEEIPQSEQAVEETTDVPPLDLVKKPVDLPEPTKQTEELYEPTKKTTVELPEVAKKVELSEPTKKEDHLPEELPEPKKDLVIEEHPTELLETAKSTEEVVAPTKNEEEFPEPTKNEEEVTEPTKQTAEHLEPEKKPISEPPQEGVEKPLECPPEEPFRVPTAETAAAESVQDPAEELQDSGPSLTEQAEKRDRAPASPPTSPGPHLPPALLPHLSDTAEFPTPPPTPPERQSPEALPTPPASPCLPPPPPPPPAPASPPAPSAHQSEDPCPASAPCHPPPRSSDSDGAFETPESTTPVKAVSPTDPQIPQLTSDDIVADTSVSDPASDFTSADRPCHSPTIVFDENKPIAASGTYNIEPFASDSTSHALTRSLSLQGGELDSPVLLDGSTAGGFRPHSESFSVGTESAPGTLRRPKKVRSGSVKKKPLLRQNSNPESPRPASSSSTPEIKKQAKPRTSSPLQAQEEAEGSSATPSPGGTLRRTRKTRVETPPPLPEETNHINQEESIVVPALPLCQEETPLPGSPTDKGNSPIPPSASYNWDPENFENIDPFKTGGSKIANSPVLGRKSPVCGPIATPPESPSVSAVEPRHPTPPAPLEEPITNPEEQPILPKRQSVRLEFDYSEENSEAAHPASPPPKKLGKKPGAKMPLRKPKLGLKKAPPVQTEQLDNNPPATQNGNEEEIPIPKVSYNFEPDKWEDPNFNPFSSKKGIANSPKLPRSSYKFDPNNFDDSIDPFKSSNNMAISPPKASASFEMSSNDYDVENDNDNIAELEDQNQNKPAKKKKTPIKSNTFRVKRSPKKSPLSDTSQEPTPADEPSSLHPQDDHATDEEKLASSTSHKWANLQDMDANLNSDQQDFPHPSDLTSFVNENSLPLQNPAQDYEIEYMEKIGSSSPPLSVKKPSLYLNLDSVSDNLTKNTCANGSEPSSPCTGSFEEMEAKITAGVKTPVLSSRPGPEGSVGDKGRKRESDALSRTQSTEMDEQPPRIDPMEAPAPALAIPLLDRLSGCDDPLQYLEPDLAETNPTAFAQKLQEELVLAALRIEALQVAKSISQCPSLSTVTPQQREVSSPVESSVSKTSLYTRTTTNYIEGESPHLPRELDHSLGIAREEIVTKEKEVLEWRRKYEDSRQEVVEMRRIVAEYEKTIAQMIEDDQKEKSLSHHTIQQLIMEKDQALADLNSVEKSLADLFRRYEKMKDVLEGFRKNEEVLKKCAQEYLSRVRKEEQRYQALKIHAEEKLDKANSEIAQVRAKAKQEQAAHQASLRKEQMKVDSLERTLEQKNKEIEELTKICDELIAKMGRS
ncbi:uncharacterized protein tacc2 isoform X4 [Thunnus thynnus]|uniref:uncharacterized protein tacc2 isoform X4 n=1 Tax=Thunnus thynnus TaxID=8237 RepID=UPI00352874A9